VATTQVPRWLAILAAGQIAFPFPAPAQPGPRPPTPEDAREGMAPPTARQLRELREQIRRQLEKPPAAGTEASTADERALDSYATRLLDYAWSDPLAFRVAATILVGEAIWAYQAWRAYRREMAGFQRQLGTVASVASNLKDTTKAFLSAERDLLRSLSSLGEADRAELKNNLGSLDPRSRRLLERAISRPAPTGPAVRPVLPLEEATKNAEKAYGDWQKKAAAESRALQALRPGVSTPAELSRVAAEADARTRAVTRFTHASGSFHAFKHEAMRGIARAARLAIGRFPVRFWRGVRTGILLVAVPAVAVGIVYAYRQEEARNRRLEDLNTATLQDRTRASGSFLHFMAEPLLLSVVTAWNRVGARDGSALAPFPCPYETLAPEQDNPHLVAIEHVMLTVLLDMERDGVDLLAERNDGSVAIVPEFYRRLFRRLLEKDARPLTLLPERDLDELVGDLAYEGRRSFLFAGSPPPAADPPPPRDLPPFSKSP